MNRIHSLPQSSFIFVSEIPSIVFQNKKILLIALAALGLIAACYLSFRHNFLRSQSTQREVTEKIAPLSPKIETLLDLNVAKLKKSIVKKEPAIVRTTSALEESPTTENSEILTEINLEIKTMANTPKPAIARTTSPLEGNPTIEGSKILAEETAEIKTMANPPKPAIARTTSPLEKSPANEGSEILAEQNAEIKTMANTPIEGTPVVKKPKTPVEKGPEVERVATPTIEFDFGEFLELPANPEDLENGPSEAEKDMYEFKIIAPEMPSPIYSPLSSPSFPSSPTLGLDADFCEY